MTGVREGSWRDWLIEVTGKGKKRGLRDWLIEVRELKGREGS